MSILQKKGLLASVGAATATLTSFVGVAPMVATIAGAAEGDGGTNQLAAEPTADGTYESCSAHFGYGKESNNSVLELTTFPVKVEGGTPAGPAPTVENGGIDVVLVIEDVNGDQLQCVPEQVTEQEWNATWGDTPFNFPPFPGPGHYAYPSVSPDAGPAALEPAALTDLDTLESVTFEVVGVPEGYTLVDPVGPSLLPQVFAGHFPVDLERLAVQTEAVIEESAGSDAAAAWSTAIDFCIAGEGGDLPNADDPALVNALQALVDFAIVEPTEVTAPVTCDDLEGPLLISAFVLFVQASADTESPITVSLPLPDVPTTTTTTTTAPPAAEAAVVTPSFTG